MATQERQERHWCDACEAKFQQAMPLLREIIAHCPGPGFATITPEDTLRDAGISTKRQVRYQRRLSSLLAGREGGA